MTFPATVPVTILDMPFDIHLFTHDGLFRWIAQADGHEWSMDGDRGFASLREALEDACATLTEELA